MLVRRKTVGTVKMYHGDVVEIQSTTLQYRRFFAISPLQCGRISKKETGTSSFRVKVETERFTFVHSRCRQNLKFCDFTSSLCRVLHD